ncbi:hypothetical protein NXC24_PB00199 (plasmid) [Rhizobium sp. NXC24]|nr:hypothetical protein NXC24_PB00199 [Rhizobium sp. NXC24]
MAPFAFGGIARRTNRRRAGEAEAWAGYFMSGCDFFDELAGISLTEETAEPLAGTAFATR